MKKTTISLAVATTVALAGALSAGVAAFADEGDDDTTSVTEETVSMDDEADDQAEAEDAEAEDAEGMGAGHTPSAEIENPGGQMIVVDEHAADAVAAAFAHAMAQGASADHANANKAAHAPE